MIDCQYVPGVREAPTISLKLLGKLLYISIIGGSLYVIFSHWTYDDPFITYRYAVNLANGLGFVYNPSERVLSTTTPLFTVILYLLGRLWDDLPRLAVLIGALSIPVGALFLWDLARTWGSNIVGWTVLLLYPTSTLLLSSLSSETPLYITFCLVAFAFYARHRYSLAGVFSALAVLARPDGLLVPAILAGHYLLRGKGAFPWKAIILFLALTLPWVIFSWAYFGSPIPVTLAAKRGQGAMAISQTFIEGFLGVVRNHASHWEFKLEAALVIMGLGYSVWKVKSWLFFLSWPLIYLIAFTLLGVSRYFWYYSPLIPGFVVAVGLGVTALVHIGKAAWTKWAPHPWNSYRKGAFVTGAIACLALIPLIFAQVQNVFQLSQHADPRYAIYRAVGEWLKAHLLPGDTVGALEVGIIGYYSQRPMIDFAGLVQPDIAARLTPSTTYEDSALWAVKHYKPSFLVLHDDYLLNVHNDYAAESCKPVERFLGEKYQYSSDLVIYDCR